MISPVLRPRLWSALLGAVAALAMATPSYADPALPSAVPDSGSRPVAAGDLRLPGAVPGTVPGYPAPTLPGGVTTLPVTGVAANPLLARIAALQEQNRQLGDRMLELRQQGDDARTQLTTAERDLVTTRDALARAQQRADEVAANAFKAAAALPPGELAQDLQGLSVLQRLSRGEQADGATTAAAGELSRARTAEQWATQALASAQDRVRRSDTQLTAAQAQLRTSDAELIRLRAENQTQLIEAERQQEAAEQKLGAAYVEGQSTTGLIASPQALAAVRYALAQLGDPYRWSEEGPDLFDCSGLMWAAYRSAGYYDLPRVSRDQYYATRSRTVAPSALLPGDLLFFASGGSWTAIHHVGMYIGGGKMVQAPSTGDVVKISEVRWSGLYAATRVVGAVPGPAIPLPPAPLPTATSASPTTPAPKPSATRTPQPGSTATVPNRPPTTPPSTPPSTPGTPSPSPTAPSPSPTTPSPSTTTPPPPSPTNPAPEPSTSETTAAPTPETSSIAPTTAESSGAPESDSSVTASASTGN